MGVGSVLHKRDNTLACPSPTSSLTVDARRQRAYGDLDPAVENLAGYEGRGVGGGAPATTIRTRP